MDKRNNMKKAVFDVFGVGSGGEESPAPAEGKRLAESKSAVPAAEKTAPIPAIIKPKPAASFLAPGTSFEGSLRTEGDIEIAGGFKGDISTEGVVLLRADIQSNITAGSLNLSNCVLTGDVVCSGTVTVSEGSKVFGGVTAKELLCAGEITGDLKISGNTALEERAQVNGSVITGTLSVIKGAVIKGSLEMHTDGSGK